MRKARFTEERTIRSGCRDVDEGALNLLQIGGHLY